jgi:hypothetical protein
MKHVWHLTRYDLRALWKQAAFLALVQIGTTIVSLNAAGTEPSSTKDRLVAQIFIMIWAATVISLQAAIAFQYPVFKTTSHWQTRPITPLTILLSRLLSACLLVALPTALINGTSLLVVDMTIGVALDNAADLTLAMLASSGPVLFLAALAGGLGRLWMTLIGILIGIFTIATKITPELDPVSPLLSSTRSWLTLVLLIIGSLVGLGVSYAKRSRVRSLALAIVTVLGMCGVGLAWPWPLSIFAEADIPEIKAPTALTATVSHDRHAVVGSFPENPTSLTYAGILMITPTSPDASWKSTRLEGVVTYPSADERPRYASAKIDDQDDLVQLVKRALGPDFTCLNADTVAPSSKFSLRQKGTAPDKPERFTGSLRVETGSPQLVAELPTTLGAKRRFDSSSLTIASSDLTGDRCNFTVLHDAARRSFTQATAAERGLANGTYLLINHRLKQAVSLTTTKNKNRRRFLSGHSRQQIDLSAYLPTNADVTPAQWLADATLGVIATTPETFFRLPVEFPLNLPASPAPAL